MLLRIAAVLAAFTAVLHIFVGTFDTLMPMLTMDLPAPVLGTLHACWHMVSLFLVVSAWAFWRGGAMARPVAWLWMGSAAIFVAVGVWQDGLVGLLELPQWTLLGASGGLSLYATRARPRFAKTDQSA
ncbi:hypothetical protein [Donghicola sp. XS_ASV15]|uniref:hypothetical protein n=1 Tax=Donghicola sp. XS_ASV15 TaxID=3241295 RepID=UPI0035193BFD